MKNELLKKGFSIFMAAMLCLSALLGTGVTVAKAAPVQKEVIPIAYPREGDANFSADWGHDTLHLMNGWTIPAATQFTFRAMGLYSGTICYCIEPGVAQTPGDTLTQFGEDFWENYPDGYNSTIDPYDIKLLIGRIFQYGYTGNVSSYWYSQEESGEFIANTIATQLVIWETVVGERDSEFNHVDPGSYDAVLEIVRSGHPLREKILTYYNTIVSSVQAHSKLPSFMSKTTGKAQDIELTWDGTQYTAALTDNNGVLGNYTFSSSDPGVTLAIRENVLTLTAPQAPVDAVSITADKKNAKRSGVVVWSDGVINPGGTIQDVVVYSAEVTDPIKGFLNAKVSYGSAKIVKTSEDSIVEGLTFTITGDDYTNTVTLDRTGTVLVENLKPGTYQITEQSIDRYVPQSVQTVNVVSGQTATVTFTNVLKRGSLQVTKSSEDGLVAGIRFKLSGISCSGATVELYATTNDSGVAIFENVLISGNTPYVLEEVSTADRYITPAKQNVIITWNTVTQAQVKNDLKYGSLKVTKTAEDSLVEGVKFKLSGTSLSGQAVELYAITDAAGVATFEKVLISGDTPYVLEEVSTADKYIVPNKQNVTILWNTVTQTTVANNLKYGGLQVTKTSEDGLVEGIRFKLSGASLSGQDVELYATTDKFGIATFEKVLISGDVPYVLEEVDTADRYVLPVKQNITILWNTVTQTTVSNHLKYGSLRVTKTSEDGLVEGIQFKLSGTSLSGQSVELYATTNSEGVAEFEKVLISGDASYVLEEVNTPDRYIVPAKQDVVIQWNTVTQAQIENNLKYGKLKVTKTAEDGMVEGVRFKLFGTSLSGQKVELFAETDANGVATFTDVLISGSTPYVLEEVDTELKYVVPAEQNVSINWNEVTEASVYNELKRGSLKVTKTSEDRLVEGVQFKLSGTSLSGEAVELFAATDNKGVATFNDVLISGSTPYVLEEVNTAERYIVPATQNVVIEWNTVTEASVYNELKRGDLRITKTSEDGFVEGIRFRLTGTSLSGAAVDLYATTNADGIALFEDVLIGSNYTVQEVNTDIRYVIPEAQTHEIKWNEVTESAFENILKKFRVEAFKVDADLFFGEVDDDDDDDMQPMALAMEPSSDEIVDMIGWPYGETQGNATLEGAVYGLFCNGELLDTYTTDENGYFLTDYYPCVGDYYLLELSPSEGYLIDPWEYYLSTYPGQYTVELNTSYMELYEDVIQGQIEIAKHSDGGNTQIETPEDGAIFMVYLKSAGSYAGAEEWERDMMIVGEDGFAMSKKLPYGVYTVTQVDGWEGRDFIEPFDVAITEDEYIYRYIINNAEFESYIKVTKTDAITGKTIPYAGAAFQIYDPEGNLVTMQYTYPQITVVDTFYTNADGTLITPETLPYGKGYSLVEVQATDGYVLDSTPVYFNVTCPDSDEEDNIIVINVVKGNMPQMGTVTITKTGEVFASVTKNDGIYQPVYKTSGLEGAVFEIYAAEDVVTPDGTVRYQKGELVDTITTGADSTATSKELHLGKYQMKEIEAPYGMLLNGETVSFALTYAGQEVSVTSTAVSMTNERQKLVLDLVKTMEQDETFKLGMNGEISKVSFGLYAAEDMVATDGTRIPKDGLLEIAQCDADGKAVFTTDIPVGSKLYVKEYATDPAYVPSDTAYPVEFVYGGQEVAAVIITVNNGNTIHNELIRGSVEGLKLDEDNNPVSGAVFGLFLEDTVEFTADTVILTVTTDLDGKFCFVNLPAMKFLIKELSCPEQYILSPRVYEVGITENGQVIEINAVNKFITGMVSVTKTDADTGEKLSGAVFEIYKDVDGDQSFRAEIDIFYGSLTEKACGIYVSEELRHGGYFLLETNAPEYHIPDTQYHYFAISEDGQQITIETSHGAGFENKAYKGSVQVVKTDADTGAKLSGAVFEVYVDADGNGIFDRSTDTLCGTLVEGESGVYSFAELRYGSYFLFESQAPNNYVANTQYHHFTISQDGQVVLIETSPGEGFVNEAYKGNIRIVKKDAASDELLSGVEFAIYDTCGNEIARGTTNDSGELIFENIRFGSYVLKEVAAKNGYVLPEGEIPIEIVENGITLTFEISNEKIPEESIIPEIPQTHDDSKIGLWIVMLLGSAVGIIGLLIGKNCKKEK